MNRKMKRIFAVLAAAMLALTSCEGFDFNEILGGVIGGDDNTEEPTDYDIVVTPSLLQFDAEGGEKEVQVEANVDYELLCEAEWVSYEKRENGVLVAADSNTSKNKRKITLVVYNKEHGIYKSATIEQEGVVVLVRAT